MRKRCVIITRRASASSSAFISRRTDASPAATLNIVSLCFTSTAFGSDLLEKSRVIRQAPGERAYHIFYQLMSGHDKTLCQKLEFDKKPVDYWYVNQAETTIKGVNDQEEYAMTDVGLI